MHNRLFRGLLSYFSILTLSLGVLSISLVSPAHALNTENVGSWSPQNSLPTAVEYATSVVYNGYVYVIGGNNGVLSVNTVYSAKLGSNGSLGNWNTELNNLPVATDSASSVVHSGRVYLIGGATNLGPTSDVYSAPLNNDGSVGAWKLENPLLSPVSNSTSVVYNGYVYAMAGKNINYNNDVYSARLNNDGSLGPWKLEIKSFPQAIINATSVVYNGHIYVIGGYNDFIYFYNTVYSATVDPIDGSIGDWTTEVNYPLYGDGFQSVVYNGRVIVMGGLRFGEYNDVNSAPLDPANGSLGGWTTETNSLPTPNAFSISIVYNGYVYVIGGRDTNGGAVSTVNSAPLYATLSQSQNTVITSRSTNFTVPPGLIDAQDPSTLSIITQPAHGTATAGSNVINYVAPPGGYTGSESLVYQICSSYNHSLCSSATLTFEVNSAPYSIGAPTTGFSSLANPLLSAAEYTLAGISLIWFGYVCRRYIK